MSETNESPPPDDAPPPPAPRPGMRLLPPGAVPALPAPQPAEEEQPSPPPAEPAAEAPPRKPTKRQANKKRTGRGSATASEPASPGSTTTPTTSSTASSDDDAKPQPPPVFVENEQLRTDLRELLLTASATANDRFAPRDTPLLLASESEADGVARPAARVIVRHLPAGVDGKGNPDLADAFAAAITLVRYLGRQIRLYFEIKRMKAGGTAPGDQPTDEAA